MPGLEALVCGAALATTDTKGSRDYALDEETALVTPPQDPGRLADSILRLLGDPDLRARLADGAQRRLAKTYQSWPRAATRFREAIEEYIDKEPA
jgi:glycosyltransferase involved in cell wall biosynthesis